MNSAQQSLEIITGHFLAKKSAAPVTCWQPPCDREGNQAKNDRAEDSAPRNQPALNPPTFGPLVMLDQKFLYSLSQVESRFCKWQQPKDF